MQLKFCDWDSLWELSLILGILLASADFERYYGRPYRANWNNSERRTSNVERRTSGERSREPTSKFRRDRWTSPRWDTRDAHTLQHYNLITSQTNFQDYISYVHTDMKVADEVSRAVMIMLMSVQARCKIRMWLAQNRNVNAHDFKCQSVNSQIIDLLDQENKEKRWFTHNTTQWHYIL